MSFKDIGSKKLFIGKMLKVWLERAEYPDGRQVAVEVIHHPGSVVILPVGSDQQIWFTYQYRHPIKQMLLELPAGTLNLGENPIDCAKRELREEIGMDASLFEKLGEIYLAPGYSNEKMHVFIAKDLYPSALKQDYSEYIEVKKYSIDEVYELLSQGSLFDAKTAAVLGMTYSVLQR